MNRAGTSSTYTTTLESFVAVGAAGSNGAGGINVWEVPLREGFRAWADTRALPLRRDRLRFIMTRSSPLKPALAASRPVRRLTSGAVRDLVGRMRWAQLASDRLGGARGVFLVDKGLLARGWHCASL